MSKYDFQQYSIPVRMQGGIERYVNQHIPPGDFLQAVFENDFIKLCGYADEENLANLPAYANLLYNHAPNVCWGSVEIVDNWLRKEK